MASEVQKCFEILIVSLFLFVTTRCFWQNLFWGFENFSDKFYSIEWKILIIFQQIFMYLYSQKLMMQSLQFFFKMAEKVSS